MSDDDPEPESIPLSDLRSGLEEGDRDQDGTTEEPTADEEGSGESVPLSGLRDAVADEGEGESATDTENAFVQEDVESVDSESVWADLLMGGGSPEGQFEAEATEEGAEGPTQVISKGICERCEYVSKPPELSCTHDGTTIHELVDVDHVRVSNCPMVGPDGEERTPGRD
jgi:hypothetical protein